MSGQFLSEQLATDVVALSRRITDSYGQIDAEAAMWRRIGKLGEECGEVVSAYIGVIGENPRKGVTHTQADVEAELLDVAACALGALEHVRGFDGQCVRMLVEHVKSRRFRQAQHDAAAAGVGVPDAREDES